MVPALAGTTGHDDLDRPVWRGRRSGHGAAGGGATHPFGIIHFVRTYRQPGTVLTDHHFSVPLDHGRPDGERIEVFGREVAAAGKAGDASLPWLVFLQGGPGFAAPRPAGRSSWLDRALDDYRVLLLDQRGTGRSTPATRQTLARAA